MRTSEVIISPVFHDSSLKIAHKKLPNIVYNSLNKYYAEKYIRREGPKFWALLH
jgi:hypothetical protein